MKKYKIGFIGAGNIASAIFNGITSSGYIKSDNILVFDTDKAKSDAFKLQGAEIAPSANALVTDSEFVFLTVKPQIYSTLLDSIKDYAVGTCFIDVAAGISVSFVKKTLGFDAAVIRVMPNTPLMYGRGASALVKSEPVTDEQFSFIRGCFDACGVTCVVDEKYINTVTAVSGSAPAFAMRFIKDLVDFAVDSGMSSEDAEILVIQTVIGSAEMIKKSDCDVQQLIKNVTSPNGTTEAGLRSLDVNDFDNILKLCLEATVNRAKELSK